ncbi:hypothetical protein EV122DRAFT_283940 [Schizophyllum commune]
MAAMFFSPDRSLRDECIRDLTALDDALKTLDEEASRLKKRLAHQAIKSLLRRGFALRLLEEGPPPDLSHVLEHEDFEEFLRTAVLSLIALAALCHQAAHLDSKYAPLLARPPIALASLVRWAEVFHPSRYDRIWNTKYGIINTISPTCAALTGVLNIERDYVQSFVLTNPRVITVTMDIWFDFLAHFRQHEILHAHSAQLLTNAMAMLIEMVAVNDDIRDVFKAEVVVLLAGRMRRAHELFRAQMGYLCQHHQACGGFDVWAGYFRVVGAMLMLPGLSELDVRPRFFGSIIQSIQCCLEYPHDEALLAVVDCGVEILHDLMADARGLGNTARATSAQIVPFLMDLRARIGLRVSIIRVERQLLRAFWSPSILRLFHRQMKLIRDGEVTQNWELPIAGVFDQQWDLYSESLREHSWKIGIPCSNRSAVSPVGYLTEIGH